jgi:hypothetical protein
MPINFEDALDQYGFVGVMVKNNPELRPLLDQAIKGEWDSARFQRELANTAWYKRFSERQRAIGVQKATDPATWAKTLEAKKLEVQALANHMGITLGKNVGLWAERAIANEWDEGALRAAWANTRGLTFATANGGLTGEAGEVENHIRETYAAYGIPVSADRIKQVARWVIGGQNSLGGIDNEVRAQAKKQYAQFATEFDQGMTLKEIADPYIQQMANTLELPGSQINLDDPAIKKALQFKDAKGVAQVKPLWQFERELKDDSRWQYTKQAKNETYAILQQVGNDWGFK